MPVSDWADLFQSAGKQYGIDPALLQAMATTESSGDPNAISPQGAVGPMQLMPETARVLGVTDPKDPKQAIPAAARLLSQNGQQFGGPEGAILAYHGGTDQKAWGPKTQAYLAKVSSNYQQLKNGSSMGTPQSQSQDDAFAAAFGSVAAPTPAKAAPYFPAGDSRNNPAAVIIGNTPDAFSAAFGSGTVPAISASSAAGQASIAANTKPSMIADIIRSIPGGVVKGVSAVEGLPGDLNALLDAGANKLTGANISTRTLPTSAEIGNAEAAPFGGFYQPKTTAGKYAETISSFAPAALAPGNALLRAARVVVPASTSEAAGQATAGTPYEPYARFGGALLGGGAVGAANELLSPKAVIPSTQNIKSAANAAYTRAEQAGVIVKQSAVQNLGQQIQHDVTQAGIDPTLHPKAVAAVNRVVNSTGDLNLKQLDILRRVANGAAGSIDKDEARIAHIVVDHIDNFVQNLSPSDTLAGNTKVASDSLNEARGLWAQQAKSNTLDQLMNRAKNRAEVVSGSGLENALRVEYRSLAQNPRKLSRFNPDEQRAIINVARGGPVGNFARTVGKLAPTNALTILGELGGYAVDPKALAVPAAGIAGRALGTYLTLKNALKASALVRGGSAQAAAVTQQNFAPNLFPALLARGQSQQQNQLTPAPQ